ncbi:MAG: amidohydrolase family protein [Myxococcota bacterium]|nr:amidohydrolase family protein [Myxococcota bacterium]
MALDVPAGAVARPGRVNAHTHLYSGLAPLGMPAPEPEPTCFVEILDRVWWRLDRALDRDTLRASARLYVAEALLKGTTTLVDHHESPNFISGSLDVLAEAVDALGARALLTYGATDRNGGLEEGQRGLDECRRFIASNQSSRIRGLVGLHASFTVSDETIRAAAALCQELGVPMHVHVAEDHADVADARERGYAGPLERLVELGALPAGSIIAHGIYLDANQVRRGADLGCWFVQNPRSNEGNNVGYATNLRASDRVALGTDGWPADMPAELDALRRLGAPHGDHEGLCLLRAQRGARLVAEHFGGIELADTVVFDADQRVRSVVVDGVEVVRDGALVHGNIEVIRSEARGAAHELWARMSAL